MAKSLVWAPTHSDLMKLSWFEMSWEGRRLWAPLPEDSADAW